MCNAIRQFQPEIHAARHRRQQELGRIFGCCNLMAQFRQWRTAVANQHCPVDFSTLWRRATKTTEPVLHRGSLG